MTESDLHDSLLRLTGTMPQPKTELPGPWLLLEEVKDICRKLHTIGGQRPCAAIKRESGQEYMLLFEAPSGREPFGVLPVDGGFLQVYGS